MQGLVISLECKPGKKIYLSISDPVSFSPARSKSAHEEECEFAKSLQECVKEWLKAFTEMVQKEYAKHGVESKLDSFDGEHR